MSVTETKIRAALEIFDQTPQQIWWKDRDLKYVLMNIHTANICGFKSSEASFEGITDYDLPVRAVELADEFCHHDQLVIRSKEQLTSISFCDYGDKGWRILMGHKFPRFDKEQNVIGMSGAAIDITECPLMRNAFLLLSNDDKLIGQQINSLNQFTYIIKNTYSDFGLTLRESECLFLMLRGKSAKESANILEISNRTVEKHINSIRQKMRCNSRSEIIDHALQHGVGNIIPKTIIGKNSLKNQSINISMYE